MVLSMNQCIKKPNLDQVEDGRKVYFLSMLEKVKSTDQQAIKESIHALAATSPNKALSLAKREQFIQLVEKLLQGEPVVSQVHPTYQCKHCIYVRSSLREQELMQVCSKQGAHIYLPVCPFWERAAGADDEWEGLPC